MVSCSPSNLISVGWLVDNQILKIQIGGAPESHVMTITNDDDYDEVAIQYLDTATETVYIVVHLLPVDTNPSVSRLLSLKHPRHPRVGHILVVNSSATPLARFFISIVGSISGVKLKAVQSIEEALEFLNSLKPQV
jgi:hypothetical protein